MLVLESIMVVSLVVNAVLVYYLIKNNKKDSDNSLYQIAHEVKNPIAVCKGYLDMLDPNNQEKVNKYIPIVRKEMNRALTIMDEYLDLKRINLNKEIMDFSLLLEDVNETMDFALNDINLSIPNIDKELLVDGDYNKLKQVLINLIKNSYEANAKNIKIDIKNTHRLLKVSIIDDGIGISPNNLKKVGDIFYTTKTMGTGIGVSMSKEIIKKHDGNLIYNSTINKGTTATITIPLKYIFC